MERSMENKKFEECMSRIRAGDKEALKEIYEAYHEYIFHLLLGITGNYHDAEDLSVEFFIKLWNQGAQYVPGGGHRRWMTVIARNLALDFLRKKGRELPLEEEQMTREADKSPAEESGYTETEDSMYIEKALSSLNPAEREIIHMKVAGDLTFREIADVMKIPMGTVTWRYRQAVSKLRRLGYEAF